MSGIAASAAYRVGDTSHPQSRSRRPAKWAPWGVLDLHADITKALDSSGIKITAVVSDPKKTERAPFTPLSDDARAHMQTGVDARDGDFLSAIKRGRGARAVDSGNYGGGRMLNSRDARALGMVDFVSGGGL